MKPRDNTWMDRAACRGLPLTLFFPEPGRSARPAKRICAVCPVQAQCWAIAQPDGIWAGTTRRERKRIRRRLAA